MKLKWESQGEGAPVLLMQGIGYTREGWGPLRERLARRYRLISYDNRGIGESDVPEGPYTADQLGEDGIAVLDEAGVERAHVLGASLGGFAAQALAAAHPERVDRLVLACTGPFGTNTPGVTTEETLRLLAEAPSLPPEVALRRFIENALAPGAPESLADELFAYRQAHPPDPAGWLAQAAAGAGWDAGDRLERITAPTLVITGSDDRVVDPRNSPLLVERIPDARLVTIEGAGHMLFWEKPEEFAAAVEGFLG